MNQDSKILKSQTVIFLLPTPIASSGVPLPYPRNILCSYLIKAEETSCVLSHSVVSYSLSPWTTAHQAPLSMEFSRQEY